MNDVWKGKAAASGADAAATEASGCAGADEALRRAALAASSAGGEAIFPELVRYLAAILKTELAFMALSQPDKPGWLRMLARYLEGSIKENYSYPMAGTPCETVIGQSFRLYPSELCRLFPMDKYAVDLGLQSYAGFPLRDTRGGSLGLIAVASRARLDDAERIESILQIFAVRAAAEIERMRGEEALRASEEQYRAIFNGSADALVLWNSGMRRVDVNPAYERLYGYTRKEVLGDGLPEQLLPGYAERRREVVRRTLAGESCQVEMESLRKNGQRFLAEVRTIPIRHRGEPHVLAISRDITERKRADERLRESEERYRLLFELESDAIVLVDADTLQHLDVNCAAVELYGYTREEMLALRSTDLSAEPAKTKTAMHFGVGRARVPLRYHRKKDGTVFPVEITASFFHLHGRRIMLAALRDITDRKQAEEERARLEAQLRQAQKMEAIGQLTGGIAHDFNNILTGVMGFMQLGIERAAELGDPKLVRYLNEAGSGARRARDLIQQMLTFSRGQHSDRRVMTLAPVVRDSMKLLRSTLLATIELEVDLDDEAPAVMVDPLQIGQVLLNLCINGRDAMGGAGRLRISVRRRHPVDAVCASCRESAHGACVVLAVRDTGAGIMPEVMERMFEPFYSTKEVGRGSGMGLAIVHGIVHAHGGHVLVDSRPGAGTEFSVCLPLAAAPLQEAHDPKGSDAAESLSLAGRVLVVEDDEPVGRFMADLLMSFDLQVVVKNDPIEAHQWLAQEPGRVDLVITDLAMAGIHGLELARRIALIHPALPIILYTGYSDGLTEQCLRDCGVAALLAKPVERGALVALLRQHLAHR